MVGVLAELKYFLNQYYEKAKQKPQIWISFGILFAVILLLRLLLWFPHWQVSQFGINNATENATLENQYRATLAQMLGGVAIGISLYYTWQRNNIAQDGQITDRFTKAVDQLGNRKIEIRLGGIYALERIANESNKDYWQVIEILTAYVRENSILDSHSELNSLRNVPISMDIQANESTKHEVPKIRTISLDIQAIFTVIIRRKYSYKHGETKKLNFQGTNLQQTNLSEANLSWANLSGADLSGANLSEANLSWANLSEANLYGAFLASADLSEANLSWANLSWANLSGADLSGANLSWANLSEASLSRANLSGANLSWANLSEASLSRANLSGADLSRANLSEANLSWADLSEANLSEANLFEAILSLADLSGANFFGADLSGASLSGADLSGADLSGADLSWADLSGADLRLANYLTIDQLSKVKTLYNAELDNDLLISLKEKYPDLFEKPKL